MDGKDISKDLERLDSQLEDLEDALKPLLDNFSGMSSELPLLDKAKLLALSAYSIESLLFSSLRLQGVAAQNHPVMTELKRVQQVFGKIKAAEEPPAPRTMTVDTEAATRMLRANLGDDKELKNRLAEQLAKERAKALLKSVKNGKRAADTDSPEGSGHEKKLKPSSLSKRPKSKGKT